MKGKGFRQIDNAFFLAITAARFEGNAYQVLLTIIHFTLGYDQRDTAEISHKTFREFTRLSRNAVRRALSSLISQGLISKVSLESNRRAATYKLNVDWRGQADLSSRGVAGEPSTSQVELTSASNPEGSQVNPPSVADEPSRGVAPPPTTTHIKKERKPSKEIPVGDAKEQSAPQPLVTLILNEMKAHLGFPGKTDKDPIPSYGKEGKAIKRMLGRGFTLDAILACWKGKVTERGGDFVSMVWVNEDIGKKAGRGAHRGSSQQLIPRDQYTKPEDYRNPRRLPKDYRSPEEIFGDN